MPTRADLPRPTLSDYGIVGNLHTTALVSRLGTLDFLCYPRVDSPTVFARLLDEEAGGTWALTLADAGARTTQLYEPDSAILVTRHLHAGGILEVVDFMPPVDEQEYCQVVRIVRGIAGSCRLTVHFAPRYPYAERAATVTEEDGHFVVQLDGERLHTYLPAGLTLEGGVIAGQLDVARGDVVPMLLQSESCGTVSGEVGEFCESLYAYTRDFWAGWSAKVTYDDEYRELIVRSAVTLKLLTSRAHGSSVAAATFGLPELVGGKLNWDYRYTWIRDSAFTMYTMLKLGLASEARHFMTWIEARCAELEDARDLGLMYRVDGGTDLEEQELDHLAGYRDSTPVHIGNGAFGQRQLDIYGELIDTVYLFDQFGEQITYSFWEHLSEIIDYVAEDWRKPDHGMWEVRDEEHQFTMSKVMAWVAIDRGVRIAQHRGFPAPMSRWIEARDALYRSIYTDHFDAEVDSFTQTRDNQEVDASLLLLPLVRFLTTDEPKWRTTMARIERDLVRGAFVTRHPQPDGSASGLAEVEGMFTMCSFWYIEVLAKSERVDEARVLFAKMVAHANHLGLFSEELAINGEQLGNFPQAFTHLALISAALQIHEQRQGQHSPGQDGPRG